MRHFQFLSGVVLLALGACALGCAEAAAEGTSAPTGGGSGTGGDGPSTSTSAGGGAGAGAGGGAATGSTGAGGTPRVVINEVSATGAEWVELFNAGSAPMDLGGYAVADADDEGGPRLDRAMRFPDGTQLDVAAYILVVGKFDSPGEGPQTECLEEGGPETCFQVSWGISAANGDHLYLLSPEDAIEDDAEYPPAAAGEGETWGRMPNGTGGFTRTQPTPGGANVGP